MASYARTISTSFPNGLDPTAVDHAIIRNSTITTEFVSSNFDYNADTVTFHFVASISAGEETELDNIITNYTYVPSIDIDNYMNQRSSDPTITDDNLAGYKIGTRWINTITGHEFVLTSGTTNAAVWNRSGIFGSELNTVNSSLRSSTSSVLAQTHITNTLTDIPAGTYRIDWYSELTSSSNATNKTYHVSVVINDDDNNPIGVKETNASIVGVYEAFYGFAEQTFTAGTHTIKLKFKRSGGKSTITIKNSRITVYRIL